MMAAAFCQDKQAVQAVWPGKGLWTMEDGTNTLHHGK